MEKDSFIIYERAAGLVRAPSRFQIYYAVAGNKLFKGFIQFCLCVRARARVCALHNNIYKVFITEDR